MAAAMTDPLPADVREYLELMVVSPWKDVDSQLAEALLVKYPAPQPARVWKSGDWALFSNGGIYEHSAHGVWRSPKGYDIDDDAGILADAVLLVRDGRPVWPERFKDHAKTLREWIRTGGSVGPLEAIADDLDGGTP